MKHFLLLSGAYCAAVLETDPAAWQAQAGIRVCPLYLLACLAAWTNPPLGAASWGAALGLIADTLSAGPLGVETVLVATLAWGAAHLRERHVWRSLLAYCLWSVALIAALSFGARLLRAGQLGAGIEFPEQLLSSAAAAFATALCGLLLLVAGRAARRLRPSTSPEPY